jgi:hypothetical protein
MESDGPAKTPPPKIKKLFGFAFATMGEHQSAGVVFMPFARLMSSRPYPNVIQPVSRFEKAGLG